MSGYTNLCDGSRRIRRRNKSYTTVGTGTTTGTTTTTVRSISTVKILISIILAVYLQRRASTVSTISTSTAFAFQSLAVRTTTAARTTTVAPSFLQQRTVTTTPRIIHTLRTMHTSTPAVDDSADSTNKGYGIDMDQNTLMETDMLVAVDENDYLVPNVVLSKKMGHTFTVDTPRATLHRAFSFFIFNAENELLLTQRAGSKITFPNVWTNTVCSHPLYGMQPHDEVDVTPEAYESNFPAIKYAAIRKCQHELGIPSQYIQHESIQFITRFHYWAADTITYGNTTECPWGEHEIDYILFFKLLPNVVLPISPNPQEVSNYKYISLKELRDTMLHDPNLLWSPWFIGILQRGGFDWWGDLDLALTGKYTNDAITYFNPPSEHVAPYNLPSHTKLTGVLKSNV